MRAFTWSSLSPVSSNAPSPRLPPRCFRPALLSKEAHFSADTLAVVHVAHMVHRSLWLMIPTDGSDQGSQSVLDGRLPKALGEEAKVTLKGMADASVAALSEFAAALPPLGRPMVVAPAAAAHVDRYVELCERLFRQSLALYSGPAAAAGPADTASSGGGAVGSKAALGVSGGSGSGPRARWQTAISRQIQLNKAKRGGHGVLAELVGGMLQRGDIDATRWCASLLLLQQLGVSLCRLEDCMGERKHTLPTGRGEGGCSHAWFSPNVALESHLLVGAVLPQPTVTFATLPATHTTVALVPKLPGAVQNAMQPASGKATEMV